jgi:hypothetical protein
MTDLQSLLRTLDVGGDVGVRSAYDGLWTWGFQVAEVVGDADFPCYRVRRRSDNTLLPALLPASDVVPDRRTASRSSRSEHDRP